MQVKIAKCQALCLKISPWSRTSHIVTWLSPSHGRITTSVKGAMRPKSAFLGQYDLFYLCELLFYEKDLSLPCTAKECFPVKTRESLRKDWRAVTALSHCADLLLRTDAGGDTAEKLFRLMECAIGFAEKAGADDLLWLVAWFELHLLQNIGVAPDFSLCQHCPPNENTWLRFAPRSGHFACPHRPATDAENTIPLHVSDRKMCLRLCNASAPFSPKEENSKTLCLGILRFLGIFLSEHLDFSPAGRRDVLELLTRKDQK